MNFEIKMRKIKSSKIEKFIKKDIQKARKKASEDYKKEFLKKFDDATSRKDFSISDLKRRDHPYATKHGSIQTYGSLKDFMVHERTGSFKRSFKITTTGSNQYQSRIKVGQSGTVKPYHSAIMNGTRLMLPRNPIEGVRKLMEDQRRPRRLMMKYINKAIKKARN